jgi:hypothetical protein
MKPTLLATLLFAAPALAQTAHFDSYTEGIIATNFTEAGITFSNLDNTLQPIGTASFIAEQADGTLTGQTGFSTPICLGSVGWSPGPGASFGRTKSYEMSTGAQADTASLELFEFGSYAGNTVTLEAWNGGSLVGSDIVTLSGGFSVVHHHLAISGVTFDHLRLVGNGPTDSGVFFGLVDEVSIGSSPFDSECPGDGTLAACPCGNNGQSGLGCDNSDSTGGAQLVASGSVSPDSVVLTASDELPHVLSIFLQGNTLISPTPFGDGLRCVGGVLKRLAAKNAVNGTVVYPAAGELSITARSAQLGDTITGGSVRYYQTYYRDPDTTFCPSGGTYNVTNAITVHW